jgi:hypothetical protein
MRLKRICPHAEGPRSPADTFMLMYDELGEARPWARMSIFSLRDG